MKSTKVQNPQRKQRSSRDELRGGRVPHTVPYRAAYHNYACAPRPYWLFSLFSRHISRTQSFQQKRHIIFLALAALKLLVSLISRLVACSARIVVDRQTDRQIDTQNDYCNPRCACAPRVNNYIIIIECRVFISTNCFCYPKKGYNMEYQGISEPIDHSYRAQNRRCSSTIWDLESCSVYMASQCSSLMQKCSFL